MRYVRARLERSVQIAMCKGDVFTQNFERPEIDSAEPKGPNPFIVPIAFTGLVPGNPLSISRNDLPQMCGSASTASNGAAFTDVYLSLG
jgi:hypothetical protein